MNKQIIKIALLFFFIGMVKTRDLQLIHSNELLRSFSNRDYSKQINSNEYRRTLQRARIVTNQPTETINYNNIYNDVVSTAIEVADDQFKPEEKIICTRFHRSIQLDDKALPKSIYRTHCVIKSPYFADRTYSFNTNNFDTQLKTFQQQLRL